MIQCLCIGECFVLMMEVCFALIIRCSCIDDAVSCLMFVIQYFV